jgi:hypothetical protein
MKTYNEKETAELANSQKEMDAVEALYAKWEDGNATREQRVLARYWRNSIAAVRKFAREVVLHPAYAFEWAAGPMEEAARVEILQSVAYLCISHPEMSLDAVLQHMVINLTEKLLDNRLSGNSTSAAHNAMMSARREMASRMVREFKGFLKQ